MMVVSDLKTYFIIGVCHQKSRGSSGAKTQGGGTVVRVRDHGEIDFAE